MSNFPGYKTKAFSESQKFFVLDPNTGSPSFVLGSDLVNQITPNSNYVYSESTRTTAQATDYAIGSLVQTAGATSAGDNFAATYLVVASGAGDFPMDNGNELLVIKGDEFLREQLATAATGEGSDLVVKPDTGETVTAELDKRTIYVGSVAELEALSLAVGVNVYLTQEGRAGEFVVKTGTPPSDPQKGIYIVLANGNYAERLFEGDIEVSWFGAVLDGVTDDYAAWDAAKVYAGDNGLSINFYGATLITQKLTIDKPIGIFGSVNLIQNSGDRRGSYFLKGADVIAIEVTTSAGSTFSDFAVVGSGTDTTQGIKLTQCGRSKLHRISVVACGSHGIEFNNGNLTSFRDIYVLGNGGDGLLVNGAATPDTNACEFMNIDARGNAGIGVNFANAWNVFGHGLVAQQNGGAGVRLDNCRQSHMVIYSEANAAGLDIELTSNANCEGNIVYAMFYNGLTDNSNADQNMIYRALEGADTRSVWDLVQGREFKMPTGVGLSGSLKAKHDANVRYDFYADESGQAHTIRWKNVSGLADKDADTAAFPLRHHYPEGTIKYNERIIFTDGDTTPDVSMGEFFLANNSGATTITNFDAGTQGQEITVLANNGNTTLEHNSNATSGIRMKGGANVNLSQYEARKFIANGSNWWIEV